MNQPAWLTKYKKEKPPVKDQITRQGMQTPMRTMPGGYQYMGAGPDGAVQSNRPVMMDTIAKHEGELVTPANKVAAAGGPDIAKTAIDQKIMEQKQQMPNVMKMEVGGVVKTPRTGQPPVGTDPRAYSDMLKRSAAVAYDASAPNALEKSMQDPLRAAAVNAPAGASADSISEAAKSAKIATANTADQAAQAAKSQQIAAAPGGDLNATVQGSSDKTLAGIANANNVMKKSLQDTQALANGTSPVYNRLANQQQNQLNQNLATQDLGNRLNMAQNPNMTSGMQNTMQAMSQQNAGAQQSNLSANLAANATQMAQEANKTAFSQGSQMYQQEMDKANTILTNSLSTGDFKTYADTFKKIYGVDVDTTAMKDQFTATQVSNGMADINKTLVQFPEATLDTGAVRQDLTSIWRAQGNTGPMDDAWANQQLETVRVTQTPWYQATHEISKDQAYSMLGNTFVDGYEDSITGKKGYEGFNIAFARALSTAGMTRDASGNITFGKSIGDIITQLTKGSSSSGGTQTVIGHTASGAPIYSSEGQSATNNANTDPTNWATGQTVTLNNAQYLVAGKNAAGDKVLADAKGQLYSSDGTKLSADDMQAVGVYQGRGGAAYYNGAAITPVGGTGTVKVTKTDTATGKPSEGVDAQGKKVIIGTDGVAKYEGLAPVVAGKQFINNGLPVVGGVNGAPITSYATTKNGTNIGTDGKGNYYAVGVNGVPIAYDYAQFDKDSANLSDTQKTDVLKGIVGNTLTTDADRTKALNSLITSEQLPDYATAAKDMTAKVAIQTGKVITIGLSNIDDIIKATHDGTYATSTAGKSQMLTSLYTSKRDAIRNYIKSTVSKMGLTADQQASAITSLETAYGIPGLDANIKTYKAQS